MLLRSYQTCNMVQNEMYFFPIMSVFTVADYVNFFIGISTFKMYTVQNKKIFSHYVCLFTVTVAGYVNIFKGILFIPNFTYILYIQDVLYQNMMISYISYSSATNVLQMYA